jgi:Tfp pilus assembly protein PilN
VKSPLNLATRPARNERAAALGFGLAALLLVVLTVQHAFVVSRLASTAATTLEAEVASLDKEIALLREQEAGLRGPRSDPASLARWSLLKELVDGRAFSWTGLLARLETALPPDVRLVAIAPETKHGHIQLSLDAVARSAEHAVAFVKALEDRPEFEDVFVLQIDEEREGARCRYKMTYLPDAASPDPTPPVAAEARAKTVEPGP